MNFLEIFLILNLLNYIGDYPFQPDFLAQGKQKSNYLLFVHSFIWAGTVSLGLIYFDLFSLTKFAMLLIGHCVIDYWKCRGLYKKQSITEMRSFYIDQSLHILQLAVCLI